MLHIDSIRTEVLTNADPVDHVVGLPPIPYPRIDWPPGRGLSAQHRRHAGSKGSLVTGGVSEAPVTDWPFVTAGRLQVRIGLTDEFSTAQFVGDGTILLTAAHCVRDGKTGDWFVDAATGLSRLGFYRAYKKGSWDQFVGTLCVATPAAWPNGQDGDPRNDYAFIKTNVASTVGWMQLGPSSSYITWSAIGYPKNYGNLYQMEQVAGAVGSTTGGVVEMLGNPMGNGASGGAWIGDLTADQAGGYVIGLNSFRSGSSMISPAFGQDVATLFAFALNSCK